MAMKKSVGVGRLPSRVEVEKQIVAWVNDLPSDEIWARVTASMIKHKAVELHPMFVGPILPAHDLDGSKRHRNKQVVWCKRFLARHRFSIRRVTRNGQNRQRGWAGIAMGAVKDFREFRSHVPTVVNLCEGPGCVSHGDGGISLEKTLTFPCSQTFNMDETPVWFEPAVNKTVAVSGGAGWLQCWVCDM